MLEALAEEAGLLAVRDEAVGVLGVSVLGAGCLRRKLGAEKLGWNPDLASLHGRPLLCTITAVVNTACEMELV